MPPLSDKDYEDDSGDDEHMKNFISLSDTEETVKRKEEHKEYNFRMRVNKKKTKSRSKKTVRKESIRIYMILYDKYC